MKKLYRSDKHKAVAGVIGGVADYFDMDPVFMRLIWLLMLIMTGVVPGLIVYLLAILMVPRHPGHTIHEG